jgi:hypothetical protein
VEHQKKADHIVNTVLQRLDLDKDGRVTPEELAKVGLNGLPNFDDLGAEGHHYDVESGESKLVNTLGPILIATVEFFLHHEGKKPYKDSGVRVVDISPMNRTISLDTRNSKR